MYKDIDSSDFIPCLFFQGMSKKVMIHFHANGEDLSHTQSLMTRFCIEFMFNVICVEYPGYGIYNESNPNIKKSQQIIIDAETVYNYVIDYFKLDHKDIMVSGRSIG